MLSMLTQYRRDLHRIPEIGFELTKTIAYVESVLKPLRCELSYPAKGAVCAYFDEGKPYTVAFRADMDALPVEEETGAEYASLHPGKMHACGHDGHTAMLLTLAKYVDSEKNLPNNVLLIFQPAEETTGGARDICDSGILERCETKAVFGIHIWPEIPEGELQTRAGAVMAKAGIVDFEAFGKSAHVARANEGADALYAGVLFLHEAYAMAESIEPANEERLLKFGCMSSGTVQNAISAHTLASGTMRAYDAKLHARMYDELCRIAQRVEQKTGCKLKLSLSEGYPPVRNDDKLHDLVIRYLGVDAPKYLETPSLTSEDFSFYQQHVPGVFFFLGTGRAEALHASKFDFDEKILQNGFELYKKLLNISFT